MSREIKFRAWDMVTVKMVVWEDLLNKHDLNEIFKYGYDLELMQYTGLKDKNGVEIYEGDITKHHSGNTITKWIWHDRFLQYVGIEADGTRRYYFELDNPELEVIGNIYENKELLEGAND